MVAGVRVGVEGFEALAVGARLSTYSGVVSRRFSGFVVSGAAPVKMDLGGGFMKKAGAPAVERGAHDGPMSLDLSLALVVETRVYQWYNIDVPARWPWTICSEVEAIDGPVDAMQRH